MSRSQPNEVLVNPAVRFLEWNGKKGCLKYYDKEAPHPTDPDKKGANIELPFNLTFLVLDQLSTIKGWSNDTEAGIYSNEIRDITKDTLMVKTFNKVDIATGVYSKIKDKISASGGYFTSNIYCAIKIDGELRIASLQFNGAALNSWIEFAKTNRADLEKKAIQIVSVGDGVKGAVKFKFPQFALKDVAEETNQIAVGLDVQLQDYLKKYLAKNVPEQTETVVDLPAAVTNTPNHIPGKIEPNTNANKPTKEEVQITPSPLPEMDNLPF